MSIENENELITDYTRNAIQAVRHDQLFLFGEETDQTDTRLIGDEADALELYESAYDLFTTKGFDKGRPISLQAQSGHERNNIISVRIAEGDLAVKGLNRQRYINYRGPYKGPYNSSDEIRKYREGSWASITRCAQVGWLLKPVVQTKRASKHDIIPVSILFEKAAKNPKKYHVHQDLKASFINL